MSKEQPAEERAARERFERSLREMEDGGLRDRRVSYCSSAGSLPTLHSYAGIDSTAA